MLDFHEIEARTCTDTVSANSFILNDFLVAVTDASNFGNSSMMKLDNSIKKITNENTGKC